MTKLLSEILLSPQSHGLVELKSSMQLINETESDTKTFFEHGTDFKSLNGWKPQNRADQLILSKFLQRTNKGQIQEIQLSED